MTKRWPDTKPLYKDAQAKAASEAGGVLLRLNLSVQLGPNGGCGAPTHVAGTNGGELPCGSFLTMLGKRAPYYCGACKSHHEDSVAGTPAKDSDADLAVFRESRSASSVGDQMREHLGLPAATPR